MPIRHTVRQGDCIASIAFANGFHPDTIWNHGDNAELKRLRADPNVLLPGDVVVVPDKQIKQHQGATDRSHRFRRQAVPEKLVLVLRKEGEPRANEPYEIDIDGAVHHGTTAGDGRIEHDIPPNARLARLSFHDGAEVYVLHLGHLDPIDEVSGVQGRLRNLGFYDGPLDGQITPELVQALQAFQASRDLEPFGEMDDETKNALREAWGE